jgi:hypothetical protein
MLKRVVGSANCSFNINSMNNDELPHEVILAIQRVLEIQPTEEIDRLDGLSERFNAIEILNDFFPNGV